MQNQTTETYGKALARCKHWHAASDARIQTYAIFLLGGERPSNSEERTSMAPKKTLKISHMKNREPMRRSSALSDVHFLSSCATLCPHQANLKQQGPDSSRKRACHSWLEKHPAHSSKICMALHVLVHAPRAHKLPTHSGLHQHTRSAPHALQKQALLR